jgi:hypothetical protein
MKTLATEPVAPREDRPTTRLLHDEPNARVVCFQLLPGQRVAEHRSASTVLVQVLEGEGVFRGENGSGASGRGRRRCSRPARRTPSTRWECRCASWS